MRARWRRELDQQAADIHETRLRDDSNVNSGADSRYAHTRRQSIVIGSKVRRIDEPYVVLRVREVDSEGINGGVPKALCFNYYGHGKWMLLADLEVAS